MFVGPTLVYYDCVEHSTLLKTKDTGTNMNAYMNLNLVKIILMDQNHMSEFFFQCKRNTSFPRAAWSNLTDE